MTILVSADEISILIYTLNSIQATSGFFISSASAYKGL